MRQRLLVGVLAAGLIGIAAERAGAEGRVDRNVVFGMYSGLALLMDGALAIHRARVPGHAVRIEHAEQADEVTSGRAPDGPDPIRVDPELLRVVAHEPHRASGIPPTSRTRSDADDVVPYEHAEVMQAALEKAGVAVELLRVPGAGHGPTFPGAVNPPDYVGAMVAWFDRHLPARP